MNAHGVPAADFDEFVGQLDLIVQERGGLWEPLSLSTVVLPGRTETHGPWPFEACAAVFTEWLKAELIGIYRLESMGAEPVDLTTDEAHAVLADRSSWRPAAGLYLFPTAKGEAAHLEEWRAVVRDEHA
ncbi:MAG TPA: hypothetical protein VMZ51_01800 [Acidimicrobiales bacterium]|nr:hypothetical protein [Acidimicrobiales bacterium]